MDGKNKTKKKLEILNKKENVKGNVLSESR